MSTEQQPEPSPRPWRIESDNLTLRPPVCFVVDANGAKVSGGFFSRADAALIVDAVNYYKPDLHCDWHELTPEDAVAHCREVAARLGDTPCARDHLQLAAWIEDRDRLRDIVRRLITIRENIFWRKDERTGLMYYDTTIDEDEASRTIEEARAAIGENEQC